ncbi:ABC transporter, ATP-binding protein [Lentilactobacillus kosonis]|uniref:ABC transporter, ATP-binding protein n=1 Tax=Lentilactobacillus kosonis TaxID=2810561 RepID=A0A401FHU7_9LACO|nr:ABC transporter, ATP-binding protein [Lentilactobacillus kosonis]
MRRRLDLAISLITRPAIIFLDEPTTGLDPRTRKQMWTTIRELVASGSTIMLTTQYLDEADQLADRVAVIDHGKLIKIGSPSELKKQVGNSSLCLTFATDETTHKAIPIIEQQLRTTATTDHTSLSVPLKNTSEITSLLDKLQAKNIAITSINVEEPTLDDVFMQLTVGTN